MRTTWSKPSDTKAKMGHQMPTILDVRSRPCMPKKQPRHTSQLHPMPRRKTMWKSGVTCFFVVKAMTSDLYGSVAKTPPSGWKAVSAARRRERDGACLTAEDDGDHEQRSGKVAPEGDEPVEQHSPDGQATVQNRHGGVLLHVRFCTEGAMVGQAHHERSSA